MRANEYVIIISVRCPVGCSTPYTPFAFMHSNGILHFFLLSALHSISIFLHIFLLYHKNTMIGRLNCTRWTSEVQSKRSVAAAFLAENIEIASCSLCLYKSCARITFCCYSFCVAWCCHRFLCLRFLFPNYLSHTHTTNVLLFSPQFRCPLAMHAHILYAWIHYCVHQIGILRIHSMLWLIAAADAATSPHAQFHTYS